MEQFQVFNEQGIRQTNFDGNQDFLLEHRIAWQTYVSEKVPDFPTHYVGRGIVICGGGFRYFTCAWVSIHLLRSNNCSLPIELWHMPGELTEEVICEMSKINVVCKNVGDYSASSIYGYAIKPFAILNSSFMEVLFLDADNNCLVDPTYLFDYHGYKENGALFWPDFWKTHPNNPIWDIVGSMDYSEHEQESGQLLIHKEHSWTALNLCMYFNQHRDVYYKFLLGDKDTFRFAWKALNQSYAMISTPVGFCGYASTTGKFQNKGTAMVQHDFSGNIAFIHQNLLKWDVVRDDELLWSKIKRFKPESTNRMFILDKVTLSNGTMLLTFDIEGDVIVENCPSDIFEKQKICLSSLKELRHSDFYFRFVLDLYQSRLRD